MIIVRKDCIEILRGRRNLYYCIALICIGVMIILTTLSFPNLLNAMERKAPELVSNPMALSDFMGKLFPNDTAGSLKIWASDVGVFYTIIVVLMLYDTVSNEIRNGMWIMPLSVGYSIRSLLLSKCLVSAASVAVPVFVLTNIYYVIANMLFTDHTFKKLPLLQSLSLCIAIAGIVAITIMLSTIFKHSISAAITMIGLVLVVPDILTLFTFGKYMPTFLLTYAYQMSDKYTDMIIPTVELILICCVLFYCSTNKIQKNPYR